MRLSSSKQNRKSAQMSTMADQKAKDGSGTNEAAEKRTSRMTIEETAEEAAEPNH